MNTQTVIEQAQEALALDLNGYLRARRRGSRPRRAPIGFRARDLVVLVLREAGVALTTSQILERVHRIRPELGRRALQVEISRLVTRGRIRTIAWGVYEA